MRDCRSKGTKGNQGGPKGGGKSNWSGGKTNWSGGKANWSGGKGKGEETRECYNCGEKGHLSKNCPKGRGKSANSVEDHNFGGGKGDGAYEQWKKNNWEPQPACIVDYKYEKTANDVGTITRSDNKDVENRDIDTICIIDGWRKLTLAVDSGAVDHVIKKDEVPFIPIVETEASKAGMCYTAANGSDIRNYGQKRMSGVNESWEPAGITAQVADVHRNLGSVIRMMEAGNRVVFDSDWSYIENKKTKKKTTMRQEHGLMSFDVWIKNQSRQQPVSTIETANKFEGLAEKAECKPCDSDNNCEHSPFTGPVNILQCC